MPGAALSLDSECRLDAPRVTRRRRIPCPIWPGVKSSGASNIFVFFLFFLQLHLETIPGNAKKKEIEFTRRTRRLDAGPYFTWLFGATGGRRRRRVPESSLFFRSSSTTTGDFNVHWNYTSATIIELIFWQAGKLASMTSSFMNLFKFIDLNIIGLSLFCFTEKSGGNHNAH